MKGLSQLPSAVKEHRKILGLTQRQVEDLAGCHWTFALDVEAGRSSVRRDKLVAILEVLGLTLGIEEASHGGNP